MRLAALAGVLSVAGAFSSQAAVISFTQSLTHIPPSEFLFAEATRTAILGDSSGPRTDTFSLSRFDSSLGTLNEVSLRISSFVTSQFDDIGGTCTGTNPTCAVDLTRTVDFSRSYSAGSTVNQAIGGQFLLDPSSCDLGGSCVGFLDVRTYSAVSTRNFLNAADLADFTGPGNFSVGVGMETTLAVSPGTNTDTVALGSSFDWDGEVTVTYDYTAASTQVPAPAGAAFLLIGFAALARRKRG